MIPVQKRLCEELNISSATVFNWVKTKILPPLETIDSETSYKNALENIYKLQKLNNRANRNFQNKKFVTYLGIKDGQRKLLLNSVIEAAENSDLNVEELVLALSLRILNSQNLLLKKTKIYDFCNDWLIENKKNKDKILNLFSNFEIKNENDDFLGAFYQSIQSISQKSKKGSFYTPAELLKEVIFPIDKTVYDPCCGSGSIFLATLSKNHKTNLIFASDTDKLALKICFVNLALFFDNPNIECNIFYNDIFEKKLNLEVKRFDYIITNPPWGYKFSINQKKYLLENYNELKSTESFSIALYNSVNLLQEKGKLLFFLPYSFLNVSTHKEIRKILLNLQAEISINLLGKAFKGVLSEAIFIKVDLENASNYINVKKISQEIVKINKDIFKKPDFIIEVESSEFCNTIIEKIYSKKHITLKNNADFALGIVTGNNKKKLSSIKTKTNEIILKGKDVCPFKIENSKDYIEFNINSFQQVADEKFYRQRKIIYRFINKRIICCIDEENRLLLNSANLFIPKKDYQFESIVCLFNSDIYNFIFQKKFHSAKILKKHLESLPLPILSREEHNQLLDLYNEFSKKSINQEKLDSVVAKIFDLTLEELNFIKGEVK